MDLELRQKVAVITGASRGIGRAIALGLAAEGCRVAVSARDEAQLATAVDELRATGAEALGVPGDMTRPADVARLVEAAGDALGGVDILVNNVGGGRIITISSIWGREAGGSVAYNAAKAAEISLTKRLALSRQGPRQQPARGIRRQPAP